MSRYNDTMIEMLTFIGEPVTKKLIDGITIISQKKVMSSKPNKREIDPAAAEALARNTTLCHFPLKLYSY